MVSSDTNENPIFQECDELEQLFMELRQFPIGTSKSERVVEKIYFIFNTPKFKNYFFSFAKNKYSSLSKMTNIDELLKDIWAEILHTANPQRSSFLNCYCYIYQTSLNADLFKLWKGLYIKLIKQKKGKRLLEDNFDFQSKTLYITNFELKAKNLVEGKRFDNHVNAIAKEDSNANSIQDIFKQAIQEFSQNLKQLDYSSTKNKLQHDIWNCWWKNFVCKLPQRTNYLTIKNYIFYYLNLRINDAYNRLKQEREKNNVSNIISQEEIFQNLVSQIAEKLPNEYQVKIDLFERDLYGIYSSIFIDKKMTLSVKKFALSYFKQKQIKTSGVWDRTIQELEKQNIVLKKSSISGKLTGIEKLFKPIFIAKINSIWLAYLYRARDYVNYDDDFSNNKTTSDIAISRNIIKLIDKAEQATKECNAAINNKLGESNYLKEFNSLNKFIYSKSGLNLQKPGSSSNLTLYINQTKEDFKNVINNINKNDFYSQVTFTKIWHINKEENCISIDSFAKEKWQYILEHNFDLQISNRDTKQLEIIIITILYYYLYCLVKLNLTEYINISQLIFDELEQMEIDE